MSHTNPGYTLIESSEKLLKEINGPSQAIMSFLNNLEYQSPLFDAPWM